MTTNAGDFLRLLEPAIRPGPPAVRRAEQAQALQVQDLQAQAPHAQAPFETQSFEQLLAQHRLPEGPAADAGATPEHNAAPKPDPLASLADFSRIQNPSLRDLVAQR